MNKQKLLTALKSKSAIFWTSAIASLIAIIRAFSLLAGVGVSEEFIMNLTTFLSAIVTAAVTLGIIVKGTPEDVIEVPPEKAEEPVKRELE